MGLGNEIIAQGIRIRAVRSYVGHGTLGVYWYKEKLVLILLYTWLEVFVVPVEINLFLDLEGSVQDTDSLQTIFRKGGVDFIHEAYGKLSFNRGSIRCLRHAINKFEKDNSGD